MLRYKRTWRPSQIRRIRKKCCVGRRSLCGFIMRVEMIYDLELIIQFLLIAEAVSVSVHYIVNL